MLTQKIATTLRHLMPRHGKVLLFGMLAWPIADATAQDSLLLRDYRQVKQADPWLTHANAAALTRFSAASIAQAELSLTKGNGGLTDYYESPNTLLFDANVEAFYRLSRRTVVFGGISYNNYTGRDMTGSAFIHPTRKPFDIVEDSLSNPGRKHRDTYRLTGAVGVDVYKGIGIGARLDYTAANYAKYKDLRHRNKLMELEASAGVYAPLTAWLCLGANYTYHRSTESLSFGVYGKSEKVYKSLIDYGAFMGIVEQVGNEGYTDKSREMPLFEDSHAVSLQAEVRPLSTLALFAAITHSRGDGYYGRQSPYTITYSGHKRHVTALQGRLTFTPHGASTPAAPHRASTPSAPHRASTPSAPHCASRFCLDVSYTNEKLAAHANTYRAMSGSNEATYYEYYDPVETGDKQWDDLRLTATAQWGIRGELPTWEVCADYQMTARKQVAYLYPFYRHQRITTHQVALAATRNICLTKGVLSCMLRAGYQKGNGYPFEDFTDIPPSSKQSLPATMDAFLYREYQYLTAAQYRVGAGIKYAFRFPGTALKTHARISADYRKATETYPYSRGTSHTLLTAAIGCTF